MIRAAAKNHADVTVVVEPADYAAVLAELAAHGGTTTLDAAQEARRQGLCAHRRLRRGDLQLVRRHAATTTAPAYRAFGGKLDPGAALRREPAPERGLLPHAGARARRRHARGRCRARSSPTTTSTTPTRPTNASPSSIRSARAACAIVKHANPCGVAEGATPARGLPQGAGLRLRPRPSAASSRSTARSTPRRRSAITEIFTEVIIAPDAERGGDRDRRREEEPAAAARRRPARSARRRPDGEDRSPAACWCSRATTRWSTTCS